MEDQVPFKVYTFWEDNEKPEVRRFGVEKSVVTSFHYLNAKLQDVYPLLKARSYTVAWRDDEGDDVIISSDEEMVTALTSLGGGLIRLFVNCKKRSFKEDECEFIFTAKSAGMPPMDSMPPSPAAGESKPQAKKKTGEEPVHSGVTCDVCDWPVVGFRYKCVVCPDYDLCANCEASGNHREHCMMRLPSPDIPRTIIKAALKRSRNFFKTFATTLTADDCPYKKHKADKNAEKKQHAEEAHARREYRRSERRPKISCTWMDLVTSYMNEFANLAGDIDFDVEAKFNSNAADKKEKNGQDAQKKEEQPKNGEPKQEQPKQASSKQEQPKEQAKPEQAKQEQPDQKQPAANNAQAPQQPQAGGSAKDIAANLKKQMPGLKKFLEKCVTDYYSSYMPPQKFDAINNPEAPLDFTATTSHKFDMTHVGRKTGEAFGFGTPNDSPMDGDMSPDKGDDWTMINNEKELLGAFGPATGPTEAAIPLGFNLPEEFQERVKINDGTNLYPPLNTATAEPEIPKVPQQTVPQGQAQAKPQAAATQPQASATQPQAAATQPQASAAKPQASAFQSPGSAFKPKATAPQPTNAEAKIPAQPKQPQYYHNKPHIDAAIRCMLGMGFTNEGGWLTQLLESKDGNIAAVIDMLNPAAPRK